MKFVMILVMIFAFAVPVGLAGDVDVIEIHDGDEVLVYELQKPKIPFKWDIGMGVIVNKYGAGPIMDLSWTKPKWGIRAGIAIYPVMDYRCKGAIRCSEVDQNTTIWGGEWGSVPLPPVAADPGYSYSFSHSPGAEVTRPTRPTIIQGTETDSAFTVMVTLPIGR